MTNETFILQHRETDVRRLALSRPPEGVDLHWCLQQIEGWQLACRKLPLWAGTEGLWFPPRISLEQCSSQATALYKRRVVERLIPPAERSTMTDLTGGMGVDFATMAPLFQRQRYVEILPHLRQLALHNLPLLGLPHALVMAPDGCLSENGREGLPTPSVPRCSIENCSFIFLDPSRRDTTGRKTVALANCTPNLLNIQDTLLAHTHWLMVKLSPMLDIRQALRQLRSVREIHVVSLQGECKELLFLMQGGATKEKATPHTHSEGKTIPLHCVNLGTDEDELTLLYPILQRGDAPSCKKEEGTSAGNLLLPSPEGMEGNFLYEPNASILKAGVQDRLCQHYDVQKLHPLSHLFVARQLVPHFPGRRFRITGWSDFSKRNLKHLLSGLSQANLAVRNFPTPVAQLRHHLHLAEGGDTYLFATTLADGRHALIRCLKA
ncbi:MAG: hypothetical protein IJ064_07665 [Bacteroidaceae bacterium]|nr:hypothetical protein [Bacteroidaceae bacterium]